MLINKLGANLLGNFLTAKEVMKAGEGTVKARQNF